MAEGLAVVGLASAIVQFVDFGGKVLLRLREATSGNYSGTLGTVQTILPLLLTTSKAIGQHVDFGDTDDETRQAVAALLTGMTTLLKDLESTMSSCLPDASDRPWRKKKRVVVSILKGNDRKLERLLVELQKYLAALCVYQTLPYQSHLNQLSTPVFLVPFHRDERFVARGDILRQIEDKIQSQKLAVLAGIGGAGKSQLAIEFCHQRKIREPSATVLWFNAGSSARLNESFRCIARALSLPGWADPTTDLKIQELVLSRLIETSAAEWLVVVDNVDDVDEFLPMHQGSSSDNSLHTLLSGHDQFQRYSVLVTTRDSRLGSRISDLNSVIDVPLMTRAEAVELLQTRGLSEEASSNCIEDLAEELARLPLAITQAAAFMVENKVKAAQYLAMLRSADEAREEALAKTYLDRRREPARENAVMLAWMLSFDSIRKTSPRAAEVLSSMSLLDRASIPEALLREDGESPVSFIEAVGVLKAFSLIQTDEESANLRIHRLVQLATRRWLINHHQLSTTEQRTMMMMSQRFPLASPAHADFGTWELCRRLSPHAQIMDQVEPITLQAKISKAELQRKMGVYDFVTNQPNIGYARLEKSSIALKGLMDERPEIKADYLQCRSDLAEAMAYLGKSVAAEMLHSEVYIETKALLGEQHPQTVCAMLQLAESLLFESKFAEAEKLYRCACNIRISLLGEENLSTLEALGYLGPALEWLGRYDECEEVLRKSVNGMQKKGLPSNHPELCFSKSRLSSVLQKQGKSKEAEELATQTLIARQQIYGMDHEKTTWSEFTLSLTLRDQGKMVDPLRLMRHVLQVRERDFGPLYILTLITIFNLAFLEEGCGQYDAARDTWRECVVRLAAAKGTWHPFTVSAAYQIITLSARSTRPTSLEKELEHSQEYWRALASNLVSPLRQVLGCPDAKRAFWVDPFLLMRTYAYVVCHRISWYLLHPWLLVLIPFGFIVTLAVCLELYINSA